MIEYQIVTRERMDEVMVLPHYEDMFKEPKLTSVALKEGEVVGAVSIFPRDDLVAMAPISATGPLVAYRMIDNLEKTLIQFGLDHYLVPLEEDSPIAPMIHKLHLKFPRLLMLVGKVDNVFWYKRYFR